MRFREIDVVGITQPLPNGAIKYVAPEEIAWAVARAFILLKVDVRDLSFLTLQKCTTWFD